MTYDDKFISAFESYYGIDFYNDDDFNITMEQLYDNIEYQMEIVNEGIKNGLVKTGNAIASGAGSAKNGIKKVGNAIINGLASGCDSAARFCDGWAKKASSKGHKKRSSAFSNLADWFRRLAKFLRGGKVTEEQAKKSSTQFNAHKEQAKKLADEEAQDNSSSDSNGEPEVNSKEATLNKYRKRLSDLETELQKAIDAGKSQKRTDRLRREIKQTKATIEKIKSSANESFVDFELVDTVCESIRMGEYDDMNDEEFDEALEGLFSKPKPLDKLLNKIKKSTNKMKSVEECDSFLSRLSNEENKFNNALSEIKNAAQQYQTDNDKKSFNAKVKPILKDLNKTCTILKIKDISGNPKDISDSEMQKYHDLLTSTREIIEQRKQELSTKAGESFMNNFDSFLDFDIDHYDMDDEVEPVEESLTDDFDDYELYMDVVTEGMFTANTKRAFVIKYGETKKALMKIVKEARAKVKAKEYDEAIKLYQQAKQGFKGLLNTARKMPDYKANEADPMNPAGKSKHSGNAKTSAINWCIDKISMCDGAIEAIQNKRMKDERKAGEAAAKAEKKAAKKAAKEAKKNGGVPAEASEAMRALDFAIEALSDVDDADEWSFEDTDE